MAAVDQAFEFIIGHEGGFDSTSTDPGNWTGGAVGKGELKGTKYGVSAAAYPSLDIANLTLDDAKEIFKRDYWDKVSGDELEPPLALLLADAAYNSGPQRAIRWLQTAVGAKVDGVLGPATVGAVNAHASARGGAATLAEFMAQRMVFDASLPTWKTFGLGWARRLAMLPYQAVQMTKM